MTDPARFARLREAVVAQIDREQSRWPRDDEKLDRLQELLWEVRAAELAEERYVAGVMA